MGRPFGDAGACQKFRVRTVWHGGNWAEKGQSLTLWKATTPGAMSMLAWPCALFRVTHATASISTAPEVAAYHQPAGCSPWA